MVSGWGELEVLIRHQEKRKREAEKQNTEGPLVRKSGPPPTLRRDHQSRVRTLPSQQTAGISTQNYLWVKKEIRSKRRQN